MKELSLDEITASKECIFDAEELVRERMTEKELTELADRLSEKRAVTANETGCGVVPVDKDERLFREQAGRLSVMLAERAERVIRVVCGLGQVLK